MSLDARLACLALVWVAALPAPAWADWVANASAGCGGGSVSPSDSSNFFAAEANVEFPGLSGTLGAASSQAGGGSVSMAARATRVGLGREYLVQSDGCFASASGAANSHVFIDAPFIGTGTATVTIRADGAFFGSSSGSVYSIGAMNWGISFGSQGLSGTLTQRHQGGNSSETASGTALGSHTFTVPVYFDTWIPLSVSAAVFAGTYEYGSLSGYFIPGNTSMWADFTNTFEFLGINELRDSSGNLVEFSAYDQDGRNYRIGATAAPVPEPASWALFGAALCALGAVRRRRVKAPHR